MPSQQIALISLTQDIFSFGIRNIAAYLEKQGITSRLLFLPNQEFDKKADHQSYQQDILMLNQLVELCADSVIVGISIYSSELDYAIRITTHLKQKLNIPVIWGGKHPSAMPEQSLQYADIVAIGESELPMAELLAKMKQGADYSKTNGFWFRKNGTIIKNPVGSMIDDLDTIPILEYASESHYIWERNINKFITLDIGNIENFLMPNPFLNIGKVYFVMTSRGCPFSCSYCFTYKNMYAGGKYLRRRSVENVIQELINIKENYKSVNFITITDDEFLSATKEYIETFSQLYKKHIGIPFHCLGHPNSVSEQKLECLIDAGLTVIQMGIQTASEKTQKLYSRKVNNQTILRTVELIHKYKTHLLPSYDIIIDNPYETKEDIVETLQFIMKIPRPYTLNLFSLAFFPGTDLYEKRTNDVGVIDTSKRFGNYKSSYLNYIFFIMKYPVPSYIVNLLLNSKIIFIFERPSVSTILYYCIYVWKWVKRMTFSKKPTGGFNLSKRMHEVRQKRGSLDETLR